MATPITPTAPRTERAAAPARAIAALATGAAAAAGLALAAFLLARVDAGVGRPAGPDRVLAAYRAGDLHDARAATAARQALQARPVDGAAYRVLARQAQVEGDGRRAIGLLEAALRHWPRDIAGRAMAADTALRDGDHPAAWLHLDALMRAQPEIARQVLTATVPALGTDAGRDALVARLRATPPWRAALPEVLRAEGLPWPDVEALWASLERAGPLAPAEVAAHVHALEQLGRPRAARARWLRSIGATHAGDAVFDGAFERPDVAGPYAWARPEVPGVELAYDGSAGDAALVARFDGRAVRFAGPAQFLALAPGRHRLLARADNRTTSGRPFEWRITCARPGPPIAVLPLPAQGRAEVQAVFHVPEDCPRQRIELHHDARYVGEQVIGGALHLLHVGILPST